jgi:hypothetical protein
MRTLQRFFDTNRMTFSTNSLVSGTTRTFARFSQAKNEVIDARVYSGIRFRTADVQGVLLGKEVANYAQKHFSKRTTTTERKEERSSTDERAAPAARSSAGSSLSCVRPPRPVPGHRAVSAGAGP